MKNVMNERADGDTHLSARTIVVSRTIDGPRRLVFEACSQVRHLARWYGPNGFTTTTRSFDFRVGGVWEFVMHGPDGTDYPNHVEYREIVAPERIVMRHGERAGDPKAFVSTITLIERGDTTEIILRSVFKTKEQRDEVVERYGAIEGGHQTLGRLAVYIAELGAKAGSQ
jgi:uncharacterized protein YndB with AHSA1/START domain